MRTATRGGWVWVVVALLIGAFIGGGGGLDVLAQATPGATGTVPPPSVTVAPPTGTAPATGTAPVGGSTGSAGPGAPAGQTPVSGVATGDGRLTITVVERAISDTEVDLGDPGDSIGDLIAFGNPVYDAANQQEIGRSQGSCVRAVVGQVYECAFTVVLPDGQLSVQGPFADSGDTVLAITGGTGDYAGARGEMGLSARDDEGAEYDFVFSIIEQ